MNFAKLFQTYGFMKQNEYSIWVITMLKEIMLIHLHVGDSALWIMISLTKAVIIIGEII